MERYTYMDGKKWRLRIGDTEYSGPDVDRFAAYENTGLEPEEIEALCDMDRREKMAEMLKLTEQIEKIDKRLTELGKSIYYHFRVSGTGGCDYLG